jgi:uncharacterized protein YbjT (DUF2867 family)
MVACKGRAGVIGATSLIGDCLLPLLLDDGYYVAAFSRRVHDTQSLFKNTHVEWQILSQAESSSFSDIFPPENEISRWVCLAPIWVVPEYFPLLLHYGVKHIVAVSSTSRFAKSDSSDIVEKEVAKRLADGENSLIEWAKTNDVSWTILRPTLTYGLGRDKNVSVIALFIQRFSFFPLLGEARGLRQPVKAHDVALCCSAALNTEKAFNRSYNISGGETLTYREMVGRIFLAMGKSPRFVTFPLWIFRTSVAYLRILPRFRHWSAAMAERMNQDLVFDHEDACRDLGFSPRPFLLTQEDLPG